MYLDLIVLFILVSYFFSGYSRGFFVEFISMVGLFLNIYLAKNLTPMFMEILKIDTYLENQGIAYIVVLFGLFILLMLLTSIINVVFKIQYKSFVNKISGGILSLIKGGIISLILIIALRIVENKFVIVKQNLATSVAVQYSDEVLPSLYELIPEDIKTMLENLSNNTLIEKNIKKFF